MTLAEKTVTTTRTAPAVAKYNYPIGYLRGFIVALVVAYHSALAYHPYAPPVPAALIPHGWWMGFPIVDPAKWSPITAFVGFNDSFFMSLMFFLSGLFFWQSFVRKGIANFLRDRILRLGLPFVVGAAVLAPIAYYPTWLQISHQVSSSTGFWHQWFRLGQWPAGPAWFIWVLLAFDCIAALLFTLAPQCGEVLRRITACISSRPAVFFAGLVAASTLVYIPLALVFTPAAWTAVGPFFFQTSRILHYFVYFLIAIGVGAWGLDRGLLAPDGKLARRWPLWIVMALVVFAVSMAYTIASLMNHPHSLARAIARDAAFVLSCATISFAFLAAFLRFFKSQSAILDSLSANSYAIYLLHYMFVSWLQYALLPASLPGYAKFAIVFLGALGLSWATAAAIRRIPAIARIV